MTTYNISKQNIFTKKDLFFTVVISLSYLIVSFLLIGFKTDQLVLIFLFNFLYYFSFYSRKFILGFSIFIVFWILFDYMKALPNYWFNNVHIADLYNLEKSIFGIKYNGSLITPNEYWLLHNQTWIDVMCGLFYLMWVPVPLVFATYLFFKQKRTFLYFSLTFLLVNLIGFVIYYLYPAAPPWYVQLNGFRFIAETPGNTAGLIRFDDFFNISLFTSMYSKSSNVFAAMPSLHSSYPVIVLYYGLKNKLGILNIFFATVMLGIWFAAIYTSHHYALDVLAGIICAISGITFLNYLKNTKKFNGFIELYLKKIS